MPPLISAPRAARRGGAGGALLGSCAARAPRAGAAAHCCVGGMGGMPAAPPKPGGMPMPPPACGNSWLIFSKTRSTCCGVVEGGGEVADGTGGGGLRASGQEGEGGEAPAQPGILPLQCRAGSLASGSFWRLTMAAAEAGPHRRQTLHCNPVE